MLEASADRREDLRVPDVHASEYDHSSQRVPVMPGHENVRLPVLGPPANGGEPDPEAGE